MFIHTFLSSVLAIVFHISYPKTGKIISPIANMQPVPRQDILATHNLPLSNRYKNPIVNNVFAENILLTLSYFFGETTVGHPVNWENIKKPFTHNLVLKPGEVFAFHNEILPQFKGDHIVTKSINFGEQDGFLSDGYLYGDGVCHLASVMDWAARDAGLTVVSPTSHDFANIPDVPKQYGVAIYTDGYNDMASDMQNLYIINNKHKPVRFIFTYQKNILTVQVVTS